MNIYIYINIYRERESHIEAHFSEILFAQTLLTRSHHCSNRSLFDSTAQLQQFFQYKAFYVKIQYNH